MTRDEFQDISRNNPRDADLSLFDLIAAQAKTIQVQNEVIQAQEVGLQTLRNDLDGLADLVAALEPADVTANTNQ